jgi:hypothetical protein
MRYFLLRVALAVLCSSALSQAAILVYKGTFTETQVTENGNAVKTKNIFVAIDDTSSNGYSIVWFKDRSGKQTETISFFQSKIERFGPALSNSTVIYYETRQEDPAGYFYDTRGLSGRNVEVVLRKSPQLLGAVPKVLTGAETIISTLFNDAYITRRFRLQLDLKATQGANASPTATATSVRDAFIEVLIERGYPPLLSPT